MKFPPKEKRAEIKYYGLHTCLALWKARPDAIICVFVEKSKIPLVSSLLKWCAEKKKAYHVVENEEMQKITDSIHHEGIAILAHELLHLSFEEMLSRLPTGKENPCCLLYLDGVQNPHNLGSILRIAAHFGIPFLLGDQQNLPSLSPSACRIAQGGQEKSRLVSLYKPKEALERLKREGFSLIASSCHGNRSLYQFSFPLRCMIIVGAEASGISSLMKKKAEEILVIPGTGAVESLNVAIASCLLLGEYWRQNHS